MASAAARNSIFGGDPLASFLALDGVAPSAAAAAAHPDGPALLRVDDIRKLLRGNLAALRAAGLVYDHTFHGASLGLSITLERYRGGRTFVGVDGTREGSEAYSVIRPTDELVAVSGEAICEPTQKSFDTLRETIVRAERPLVLTFVRGRGARLRSWTTAPRARQWRPR
ncbi:hypothetical protein M885DRAFT_332104 [Pelagophyceae sp. CCMP2097]|nr:hypothetical protein M885DRAFT_332104 [Pelagophyceae sp. CCMP2097]